MDLITMHTIHDGIPPSMTKYFHEEIESSLQGEAKLFFLGHNGVPLVDYEYLGIVLRVK